LNEPGEAVTRRAVVETGSALGGTSWHIGATGETVTGNLLEPLERHGWHILHAVPCPSGGDIDHLAIGPSGMFVINTKFLRGVQVQADGDHLRLDGRCRDGDLIERSRLEAFEASEVLSTATGVQVSAVPVLAFVDASEVEVEGRPGDVLVTDVQRLTAQMIGEGGSQLDSREIEILFRAARDLRVWLGIDG
jgi:hypothetical protein